VPRVTIIALLVVSLAACGGDENTFEREGVSFTYPENWGEAEYEAVDPAAVFGTAFTPEENSLTGLIFEISRGDVTVTEKNIDDVLADAAGALDPSTEGPSRLTVGGLPAIRFVSHPQAGLTRRVTFVFDGTTIYALNCAFTPERAEEMKRGCEQVVTSFAVEE
jgi:hypothetical protein